MIYDIGYMICAKCAADLSIFKYMPRLCDQTCAQQTAMYF